MRKMMTALGMAGVLAFSAGAWAHETGKQHTHKSKRMKKKVDSTPRGDTSTTTETKTEKTYKPK